jgi:hypothetical protein
VPQISTINVGNGDIELWVVSGEVVGEKKWSNTHLSGGGGSGRIYDGAGRISIAPIESKTTTHDQVFVRGDDGRETVVELANANLAVRAGHRVSAIWGSRPGQDGGPYLAFYNHHTDALSQFPGPDLVKPVFPIKARVIVGVIVSFVPHLYVFGAILSFTLLGSAVVGYFRKRARLAALTNHVRTLVPKLLERTSKGQPSLPASEAGYAS